MVQDLGAMGQGTGPELRCGSKDMRVFLDIGDPFVTKGLADERVVLETAHSVVEDVVLFNCHCCKILHGLHENEHEHIPLLRGQMYHKYDDEIALFDQRLGR